MWWEHLGILLSLVHLIVRRLLGLPVMVRADVAEDVELLVLRHENAVLCRIGGVTANPTGRRSTKGAIFVDGPCSGA
jgi:hypothetical protein